MKILTLNLHCFAEENIQSNQSRIINEILKNDFDVIFLQEVAQNRTGRTIFDDIKEDNYGYILKQGLALAGVNYYYHYKIGNKAFELYDEGLAILSKTKLIDKNYFYVSKTIDYNNWSTRIVISAKTVIEDKEIVLTSVHLGWSDENELFEDQVDLLMKNLNNEDINIIAGDYNISPGTKEYNYIVGKGYIDLFYNQNKEYYNIPTHVNDIDEKDGSSRIDYVMSNRQFKVINRKLLLNKNLVSDHYGVSIEIK